MTFYLQILNIILKLVQQWINIVYISFIYKFSVVKMCHTSWIKYIEHVVRCGHIQTIVGWDISKSDSFRPVLQKKKKKTELVAILLLSVCVASFTFIISFLKEICLLVILFAKCRPSFTCNWFIFPKKFYDLFIFV